MAPKALSDETRVQQFASIRMESQSPHRGEAEEKGTVTFSGSVGRFSGVWTLAGPIRTVGVWRAQRTPPLYVPGTASPAPNPVASRT